MSSPPPSFAAVVDLNPGRTVHVFRDHPRLHTIKVNQVNLQPIDPAQLDQAKEYVYWRWFLLFSHSPWHTFSVPDLRFVGGGPLHVPPGTSFYVELLHALPVEPDLRPIRLAGDLDYDIVPHAEPEP